MSAYLLWLPHRCLGGPAMILDEGIGVNHLIIARAGTRNPLQSPFSTFTGPGDRKRIKLFLGRKALPKTLIAMSTPVVHADDPGTFRG